MAAWLRAHWLSLVIVGGIAVGIYTGVSRQDSANETAAALKVEVDSNRAQRVATFARTCERGNLVRAYLLFDAALIPTDTDERKALAMHAFKLLDCTPRVDGKFPELSPKASAEFLADFERTYGP